jgi:CSLREA domain-containing protein
MRLAVRVESEARRPRGTIDAGIREMRNFLGAVLVLVIAGAAHGATYVVNSTLDTDDAAADGVCDDGAGHCTLRAAITQANRDAAADTIQFAIAGAGVHTISPSTALPAIVQSLAIDATTQPGYAGAPLIELASNDALSNGLVFNPGGTSQSCSVRGLALYGFTNFAISITDETCTIAANYVGLTAIGVVPTAHNTMGIRVHSTTANPVTIGGATTADRNVISANDNGGSSGILLDFGSSGGHIIGNYIGTNPAGTAAVDTAQIGIGANGTHLIESNLISGNIVGIRTNGGPSALTIQNNLIGTDISGTSALASNHGYGIELTTAGNTVVGNTISGNQYGVYLDGTSSVSGNVIAGNLIGTTASGTGAVGNSDGVVLSGSVTNNTIGGNVAAERNIISGNNVGVIVFLQNGATDSIIGNYIGLDVNGNADGNDTGVYVTASTNGLTVGGTRPSMRNIISGNATDGVNFNTLQPPGNSLLGNYIGTSPDGLSARPNGVGVLLNTAAYVNIGNGSGGGNLISGNSGAGVSLTSVSISSPTQLNTVAGNSIGVDVNGAPLSNQIGVLIDYYSQNNLIGGPSGAGNVVRSNTQAGIVIKEGVNHRIQANAIDGNGALGIDLGGDGVTANDVGDSDTGPNQLQNYPVIALASSDGINSWFSGSLATAQSTSYTLEFFASPSCDPSGNGQGAMYVGSLTTNTDASGNASFVAVLPVATAGMVVTATAYNASSGTSEFSACHTIKTCPVIGLTPSTLPSGQVGTVYSELLGASAGSAPYSFAVASGSLPSGLTLAADGTLAGTPTTSGDFAFSVSVTDADMCPGQRSYALHVADANADLAVAGGPDFGTAPDLGGAPDDLGETGGEDLASPPPPDLADGGHVGGGCGCHVGSRRGDGSGVWACCAIFLALGVSRWRRDRGCRHSDRRRSCHGCRRRPHTAE